jgi:hypothetical protein
MKRRIRFGVAVLVSVLGIGCSSSRSTMLTRNECNTGWNKINHLHGTPITLKVPTHLRMYVYDKYYMEKVSVAGVSRWQRADIPTLHDFGSEILYTDKIFTTDFIRPAAGTFNLDVDYTQDQYVKRVQQDITDETLKDITNLLSTLPGKFFPLPSAVKASGQDATDWKEIKSVVAANVFEIDDPNFESNISDFVQTHLNSRALAATPMGLIPENREGFGDPGTFIPPFH